MAGHRKETVQCILCPTVYSRRASPSAGLRRQVCPKCSQRTAASFKDQSGDKNPAWKGGHQYWQAGKLGRDKDGLSWKVQRQLCWERDNYTCQDCGKTREQLGCRPHVDHEIPYRLSFSHALDNLKCRCPSCHKKAEAQRTELWQGKVFGGVVGRGRVTKARSSQRKESREEKPGCVECSSKRRVLNGNDRCAPCQRDLIDIPMAKEMRAFGRSYQEIGDVLGLTKVAVWKWLNS